MTLSNVLDFLKDDSDDPPSLKTGCKNFIPSDLGRSHFYENCDRLI
ncbi:hypothetical protein N0Y54_41790 [Nostoc punctiforme UO1]